MISLPVGIHAGIEEPRLGDPKASEAGEAR